MMFGPHCVVVSVSLHHKNYGSLKLVRKLRGILVPAIRVMVALSPSGWYLDVLVIEKQEESGTR